MQKLGSFLQKFFAKARFTICSQISEAVLSDACSEKENACVLLPRLNTTHLIIRL